MQNWAKLTYYAGQCDGIMTVNTATEDDYVVLGALVVFHFLIRTTFIHHHDGDIHNFGKLYKNS